MRRRSLTTPKWETHVSQTIHKVKKESKSRSLKSSDLYECVCIFISDHLKKQMFSYATVSLYYQHLKSFYTWLCENGKITDIHNVSTCLLRDYFSYLEDVKNYKKSTLEGVQTALERFFRSMRLRRLIKDNPLRDFQIHARRNMNSVEILTPFDIKMLLRSVKEHYQYLKDNNKHDCFSLSIFFKQ